MQVFDSFISMFCALVETSHEAMTETLEILNAAHDSKLVTAVFNDVSPKGIEITFPSGRQEIAKKPRVKSLREYQDKHAGYDIERGEFVAYDLDSGRVITTHVGEGGLFERYLLGTSDEVHAKILKLANKYKLNCDNSFTDRLRKADAKKNA
jgi:hypothetical protein